MWRENLGANPRTRRASGNAGAFSEVSQPAALAGAAIPCLRLCNRRCPGPVELESVRRAAAWCDYLEDHARRIYHCVTARTDTAVRLLGEKLRALKLTAPFTVRDVYRPQWTGLTEPDDAARALEVLKIWAGWFPSKGRASRWWPARHGLLHQPAENLGEELMNYLRSFLEAKKRAGPMYLQLTKLTKPPVSVLSSESPTRSSGPLSPKQTPRAAEAPRTRT